MVTTKTFGQGNKYTSVTVDDKFKGYTIRREIEVPARGAYYPYTNTRIVWEAWINKGGAVSDDVFLGEFRTRKSGIEQIISY